MLGRVAAWVKGHRDRGSTEGDSDPFWVSLNASARLFERADLAEMVDAAVRSTGIDPASICLEVSETSLVDDPEAADERMRALLDVGVRLAVDGFGTGVASPGFVNRFPIHMVKISRALIAELGSSGRHAAIVDGVVRMARALGLQTVGEGVETGEQAAALRATGCRMAQGNHWSRPLPAESFTRMLERQRVDARARQGLQGA
jgi:EAL domain-containing protein (putative c-di-GMP-specific phosphodiesterase class I)